MANMKNMKKNLKHLIKCPACQKKYQHRRTIIIEDSGDRTVFHLTCQNCQTATLVFVSRNKMGVVSLGMATDLSADDARVFFGKEPITSDHVIDVYEKLKKEGVKLNSFI